MFSSPDSNTKGDRHLSCFLSSNRTGKRPVACEVVTLLHHHQTGNRDSTEQRYDEHYVRSVTRAIFRVSPVMTHQRTADVTITTNLHFVGGRNAART